MSQNDFTIANQSFPAFRADLNSALQALASNNSGTSAPTTTFANMWWYDSTNNIMYIRNEDNDAWIKFAELDQTNDKFVLSGTLQLDDGTVSAPALTFNSDTNMGIYRGGTDILKFVTAGTDRVTILANGDTGIGVSPSTTLHVKSANPHFRLETTSAVASGGTVYNTLRDSTGSDVFLNGFAGLANCYQFATIFANGFMRFLTGNQVEAMRIDSSGRMLLGTTTEGEATGDDLTIATTGATGITIRSGTSSDGHLFFSDGTSGADEYRGYLQYNHQQNRLSFATDAIERMRIDANGNVQVGNSAPIDSSKFNVFGVKAQSSGIPQQGINVTDNASSTSEGNGGAIAFSGLYAPGSWTTFGSIEGSKANSTSGDYGGGLVFKTRTNLNNNYERMRIDANGSITTTASSGNMASFSSSTNAVEFKILSPTANVVRLDTGAGDALAFAPAGTERMRIESSTGNLLVGTSGNVGNGGKFQVKRTDNGACGYFETLNNAGGSQNVVDIVSATNAVFTPLRFWVNGYGSILGGSIGTSSSGTSYNTTSDHRLKENVTADWDATTRLKQLNPVRFNFIADADTTVDGFLAHEVQSVVPEAITGTHNEVDADGNPVYQQIDQSKIVPLLVKTIQELEARIVALETA